MNAVRFRALLVLMLAMAAWAGAAAWRPTQHMADSRPRVDLEAVFPEKFAGWEVDKRMPVQLVSPDTEALLNKIYNQTLSRTYVNALGERIMLSIAYGGDQSDGTRAHRPEVCYPAQGFQILKQQSALVTLDQHQVPARQLVAKLGGRVEPITYWVVVGETIAVSGTEQKLAQLRYSMRGQIPDGMLVRVSSIDLDSARAFAAHQAFLVQMMRATDASHRVRVFGA